MRTWYCGKAELANPTLKSFIVNQASFPAEHKRVAQIDSFNDPRATVSSQLFLGSNSPKTTQLSFFTLYLRNVSLVFHALHSGANEFILGSFFYGTNVKSEWHLPRILTYKCNYDDVLFIMSPLTAHFIASMI